MGRGGKSGKRLVLATLGVVGALVFAGCDWPMFAFDVAHTGSSPDKAINSANVSTVESGRAVEAAGFRLETHSDLLRNPADNHELRVFDPAIRGRTDQVILKFRKPG